MYRTSRFSAGPVCCPTARSTRRSSGCSAPAGSPRSRRTPRGVPPAADRLPDHARRLGSTSAEEITDVGPSAWEDDNFNMRFAFFSRTDSEVRLRILEGRRSRLQERLDRARHRRGRRRPLPQRAAAPLHRVRRARGAVALGPDQRRARRWPAGLARAPQSGDGRAERTPIAATSSSPATPTHRHHLKHPQGKGRTSPMGSVRVGIVGVGNCADLPDPGRRVLQGRRRRLKFRMWRRRFVREMPEAKPPPPSPIRNYEVLGLNSGGSGGGGGRLRWSLRYE